MAVISNLMFAVGFKVADGALKKAEKQTAALEQNWAAVGVAAGVVTAAVVGIGIAGVHAASEFNDSMRSIQMATGQTAEQMEETKAVATDLYNQNFGENWQDLGDAISSVQQITGQTGEDLKNTTREALLLRDAFGYEVKESIDAAQNAVDLFGISNTEAFNLIAQGTQKGLDASGDLLQTVGEYSVYFETLGFTANEMFDTLAAGAEGGARNVDLVADAVKEFGIMAKDNSDSTIEGMQMLGLDADKMMKTIASGGPEAKKSFDTIVQMISDIEDPVERNTVGVSLFGTKFEDLESTIIGSMGTAKSQFDMTKNTMDELNDIKFSSPGEAFAMLGRQVETGILIPLGEKLLPYLDDFSTWLGNAGPQIADVGAQVMDWLASGFSVAADAAKFLVDNIDVLGPAIGAFALVMGIKLIPVMWAMATAGWAAVTPWLPFIAIALGVAAAVAGVILIFKNWGAISTWLVDVWNTFSTWVVGLFTSIGEFFVTWGGIIWNAITSVVMSIVNTVVAYWNAFGTMTRAVFGAIVGFFSSVWNSIWSTVSDIASSIVSFVTGAWDTIKTKATNTWEGIGTGLSNMWTGVKNTFSTGVNFITGLINDMIAKINSALSIKLPDWLGGKEFAINIPEIPEIPVDGSHANGLPNVPFDGYVAELHKDERVLTADENKAYSAGYTPETAPARATTGSTSTNRQEIYLKVDLGGSTMPQHQEDAFLAKLDGVLESVIRRMGLEVSTA